MRRDYLLTRGKRDERGKNISHHRSFPLLHSLDEIRRVLYKKVLDKVPGNPGGQDPAIQQNNVEM